MLGFFSVGRTFMEFEFFGYHRFISRVEDGFLFVIFDMLSHVRELIVKGISLVDKLMFFFAEQFLDRFEDFTAFAGKRDGVFLLIHLAVIDRLSVAVFTDLAALEVFRTAFKVDTRFQSRNFIESVQSIT